MAPGRPVKCLNKGPGNKRFVFKTFWERVEDVDIDVFRSLDPVKINPTQGSSFFHENLLQWRELNAALDFVNLYEEVLPLVQTLPQLLLHKEIIFDRLLSCLCLNSLLSLEPILSLLTSLARDLQEDYLVFMPWFMDSCLNLLQSGGDREPDVLEQVFTSISLVFKYLRKILIEDIELVLRITRRLRCYGQPYVQEFSAEALSFLFRNAPKKQRNIGLKKILLEIDIDKSENAISSGSLLLYHSVKGSSTTFHSRAEAILRLLLSEDVLSRKKDAGNSVVLNVLQKTLYLLCENFKREKLELLWTCLLEEIVSHNERGTIVDDTQRQFNSRHLVSLLSLLNTILEYKRGNRVKDYTPLLELSERLVCNKVLLDDIQSPEEFPGPLALSLSFSSKPTVVSETFRFLLNLVRNHSKVGGASRGPPVIAGVAASWRIAFKCPQANCLLPFIKGLLEQETSLIRPFASYLTSAFQHFIILEPSGVLLLLLHFFEKLEITGENFSSLLKDEGCESSIFVEVIAGLLIQRLKHHVFQIGESIKQCLQVLSTNPAVLWVALQCIPYVVTIEPELFSLPWDFAFVIDNMLGEDEGADSVYAWKCLLGSALLSQLDVVKRIKKPHPEATASRILMLACRHSDCFYILKAAADFLDDTLRDNVDFRLDTLLGVPQKLQINLGKRNKQLRLQTLRIFALFEPSYLDDVNSGPSKKMKGNDGKVCSTSQLQYHELFRDLLSIETAPFYLDGSRQTCNLLSGIKVALQSKKISSSFIVPLLHAMLGVIQNRFAPVWDVAIDCLACLIEEHGNVTWNIFLDYLSESQELYYGGDLERKKEDNFQHDGFHPKDLWTLWESVFNVQEDATDTATLMCLLLRTMQKAPRAVESGSQQIMPLFLRFVGHSEDGHGSDTANNGGKRWRNVLKEWLVMLKKLKNIYLLPNSTVIKDLLLNRFLMDEDATIQEHVFEILLNWRDDFVSSYEDHLRNLFSSRTLREEITKWKIGRDSQQIAEAHRANLIPLIVKILYPKLRKGSSKLCGKSTKVIHRNVILSFLTQVDVGELAPLCHLMLQPLQSSFIEGAISRVQQGRYMWEDIIENDVTEPFINFLHCDYVGMLPHKRKLGFLHLVKGILEVFDRTHVWPYLNIFFAFILRLLQSSSCMDDDMVNTSGGDYLSKTEVGTRNLVVESQNAIGMDEVHSISSKSGFLNEPLHLPEQGGDGINGNLLHGIKAGTLDAKRFGSKIVMKGRDSVRPLCLKIISMLLNKFDDFEFHPSYWDIFFSSMKISILRFKEENNSNAVPSSLFSCFLAMSSSSNLAPLLCKEQVLVRNIVSILSVKNASQPIISAVMNFVENIVNLENEEKDKGNAISYVGEILIPHLGMLLKGLEEQLQIQQENTRMKGRTLLHQAFKILVFLGKHVEDAGQASKLVEILLPLLRPKKFSKQDFCLQIIYIIKGLSLALDTSSIYKCLVAFSSVLSFSSSQDMRSAVCEVIQQFAFHHGSFLKVAPLLSDLNSMSQKYIGEYDYECRLNAYSCLGQFAWTELSYCQIFLVLSNVVFDMGSEDMSIRQSASNCLASFIKTAKRTDVAEMASCHICVGQGSKLHKMELCGASVENILPLIQNFLFPRIKHAMANDSLTVRREWVNLFREVVVSFSSHPMFVEYNALISEDPEVDFFNNIVHLQVHRRAKAMSRFRSTCVKGHFSSDILASTFVPLFMTSIFEGGDKDAYLAEAAIQTLGCIAQQLKWNAYYAFLLRCFSLINSKSENQKALTRLACIVIDKFHYFCGEQGETSEAGQKALIIEHLQKKVLPEISKLMMRKEGIVNVPVALAVVKILKLMDGEVIEAEVPRLLQTIINLLKSRMQSVRDEARSTLVAVAEALGFKFLSSLFKIMQQTLTRGYELHVLGYTIHAILVKVASTMRVGEIDDCVHGLLSLLETEIFGQVSEEKDVEAVAGKMKETRNAQSFDSIRIVAQTMTFNMHSKSLLNLVLRNLKFTLVPKAKQNMELTLKNMAAGVQSNASCGTKDLFLFLRALLCESMKDESTTEGDESMKKPSDNGSANDISTALSLPNIHMITEYGLQLFLHKLKHLKVGEKDTALLSMLDPFINILQKCLSSKYDGIVAAAMKCLCYLLKVPLLATERIGPKLVSIIFTIAQRSVKAENSLFQSSLNLMIVILRHCKTLKISQDQLHALLQFPVFIDIERDANSVALSVLKAIIGRKLMVPELYDLMLKVQNIMITSQAANVRQLCSQVLLQFLLDYPLGGKRLQQHIDQLVQHVGYEHISGRESALEMLHTILVKFPRSVIEQQTESLFLTLVTRLVNDNVNHVRAMIGTVLKDLIANTSGDMSQRMLDFTFSWIKGDKCSLWRPAAQVFTFFIESMNGFERHLDELLPAAEKILGHISSVEDASTDKHSPALWRGAYSVLVMLEKLIQRFPDCSQHESFKGIWELVLTLLLHQHVWVRKVCNRLLAFYFQNTQADGSSIRHLLSPTNLVFLAGSLCQLLDSALLDDDLSDLLHNNLVFVGVLLDKLPMDALLKLKTPSSEVPNVDKLSTGLKLLKVSKYEKEHSAKMQGISVLHAVFWRLEETALRAQVLQCKSIFKWYAAIVRQLDGSIDSYLPSMLHPLYKITQSSAARIVSEDLKLLGEDVLHQIQDVVGTEKFLAFYNSVRISVKERKEKRKRMQKIVALVDPERTAKRKIRLGAKRQEQKKRKRMKIV